MKESIKRFVLCLEQQLTMKNKIIERKLKRETQDLRGSTNYLRSQERERLFYYSYHRVTIIDYLY